METNHRRRRVILFSIDVALYLLAKSKYEKNVYAILKVAYQETITTKNFGCTPSVAESIMCILPISIFLGHLVHNTEVTWFSTAHTVPYIQIILTQNLTCCHTSIHDTSLEKTWSARGIFFSRFHNRAPV